MAAATFEDLVAVRGDAATIWASVLKEAIKRRNPGFNESYYGCPSQPPAAPPRAEGPAERPPSRYFQQEPAAATPAPASATEPVAEIAERSDRGDRAERGDRGERGRRGRRRDATPCGHCGCGHE
jgi:hypothetical protein